MINGIVSVTNTGGTPSYVDVLKEIAGTPTVLITTDSEPSGESNTLFIRSWKLTLTNLGTDYNTDAADFNTSVYVGPWQMMEPDVLAANQIWWFGTKLAPGKSLTYTGVGETLYISADPAATSPDVNADVLVVFQWT
jgi:hypothetical protein